MKIVMIGGGAHRVLGILRSALAIPGVMDGGEVDLFDLNQARSEAMGRMLLKTPEQKRCGCKIKWSGTLEEALVGADVVGVIMPAMPPRAYFDSTEVCHRHGFISSDNISPTGALCAVRIAPVLMDIARKMESKCPDAWLINFVNPTAVMSGMINNHTRIRTLGVCQGFMNHLWDIPRLFGKDEIVDSMDIHAAGINHLSYIVKGNWNHQDLFTALRETLTSEWKLPNLQPWWSAAAKANICRNVQKLYRIWRELGVLVFSSEPDGLAHLMYEEKVEEEKMEHLANGSVEQELQQYSNRRAEEERKFLLLLSSELDEKFWAEGWKTNPTFKRADEDIFVQIFSALSGTREVKITTSQLNHGAISGIKDREVVEYTHRMFKDKISHEGPFEIPEVVQGLSSGFAAHQTLLGDALATEDPEALARALVAYPMNPYSRSSRAAFKELIAVSSEDLSPAYRRAAEYL
ncbi:MAG: hypothetical protein ACFUZC_11115 [Chthoniobacteraceae bacterium]